MCAIRIKPLVASRRQRDDDGEEEGSVAGEVEDDSLSEGSAISNGDEDADIEGSETSDAEMEHNQSAITEAPAINGHAPQTGAVQQESTKPHSNSTFKTSADTEAMMHGLKAENDQDTVEEVAFDDMAEPPDEAVPEATQGPPKAPRNETILERNRREHKEYLKQRDQNPAFVPNRGGFFLHDNRSTTGTASNARPFSKGRGRGSYNGLPPGRGVLPTEPADLPWAHDLHDSTTVVEKATPAPASTGSLNGRAPLGPSQSALPASSQIPPNRSFSTSVLLGNVSVTISLPGMAKRVAVPNVPRKLHTLLPQHRPPLRRDKPVRVSLPDQMARYVFPSKDRSFIFIPRAMRPNQHAFVRGRGRGSFAGSRRTSIFGGSTYSPSIAMSRRSSLAGASQSGVHSPTGGNMPKYGFQAGELGKPVVRLPPMTRPMASGAVSMQGYGSQPPLQLGPYPQAPLQQSQQIILPMHQPRPQKTVSVADIESPAKFPFNPPQPQQEQPFHQQVPNEVEHAAMYNHHSRQPSHPGQPSGTPSQIPERAIYAPSFQPYGYPPPQSYYAAPYPPATMFYPSMDGGMPDFSGAVAPAVMAPTFVPGAPYVMAPPPPPPPAADSSTQNGMVAHESNGMVYYYDPTQIQEQATGEAPRQAFHVAPSFGMGGMMTPPAYFYPPAPNGMYFAPQ